MLYGVVVLDAEMTAAESLARLAQRGFWRSVESSYAAMVIDDLAACVREADEGSTFTRDDAVRLVGAGSTGATRVVIAQERGATRFWYWFDPHDLLDALTNSDSGATLADILSLSPDSPHLLEARQIRTVRNPDAAPRPFVALRDREVVGLVENPTPKVAPPVGRTTARLDQFKRIDAAVGVSMRGDATRGFELPAGGIANESLASESQVLSVYPFLDAPLQVEVETPFELSVGLAADEQTHLDGSKMVIELAAGVTHVRLDIRVVAEGFDAPNGWTAALDVDAAKPTDARVPITLIARHQKAGTRATDLIVQFIRDHVTIGTARKSIVVRRKGAAEATADKRGESLLETATAFSPLSFSPVPAPDVTLDIVSTGSSSVRGTYLCSIRNAHGVEVPDAPIPIDLGADAVTFADGIIRSMRAAAGTELISNMLNGHAKRIASKLPVEFWEILRRVAVRVGPEKITLQVNSADPFVPWELARVNPPLHPQCEGAPPPFLGAQVIMGRWVANDGVIPPNPRATLTVGAMAVMVGNYAPGSGLPPLNMAIAEVQELKRQHTDLPTEVFPCTANQLKQLLDAKSAFGAIERGAELVHFAGHGQVLTHDPNDNALFFSDGKPISPVLFMQSDLGDQHAPFMFLNACMVGTGAESLGDYGGFPGNCLGGGFSGFVAPLWAVSDTVAMRIAIAFYDQALGSATRAPRRVGEILRDIRGGYSANDETEATYMAYVFYGNPNLTFTPSRTH